MDVLELEAMKARNGTLKLVGDPVPRIVAMWLRSLNRAIVVMDPDLEVLIFADRASPTEFAVSVAVPTADELEDVKLLKLGKCGCGIATVVEHRHYIPDSDSPYCPCGIRMGVLHEHAGFLVPPSSVYSPWTPYPPPPPPPSSVP